MTDVAGFTRPGRQPGEIAALRVGAEPDVFAARQLARVLGREAGLVGPDQVRLATAVSEVGREALTVGGAWLVFVVREPPALVVLVSADRPLSPDAAGLAAAARLVELTVPPPGTDHPISLAKPLAAGAVLDEERRAGLRRALAATAPVSPADELRIQNTELVSALEELRDQQNELVRLNEELEETNRGVMALYNQLSSELEETNRGVVALYAELDERGVALERANEAKSRFLRNVSHELRAPVNSVLGLARLLLDPYGDALSDEQRHQVGFILSSSTDLLGLVNDLLDLAKAESGALEPDIDEVDPQGLLAQLEGSMRPLLTRPRVRLVFETAPDLGVVRTDRSLLGRVLSNLVTNALKFTERGEVRVIARPGPPAAAPAGEAASAASATGPTSLAGEPGHEMIVFEVRDTGIGISPEDLDRVFDEFYQVRTPLHAEVRGTGLGLPYARRVCGLLGGRLDLDSHLGMGSTFTVTLPRDAERVAGLLAQSSTGPIPLPEPPKAGTVLVVDDDPAFRAKMRTLLDGRAERVIEALDGLEALDLLRAELPDVTFLDLMMPNLGGGEVLTEMANDPHLRDLPVIIVTWGDSHATSGGPIGSAMAVLAKSTLSQTTIDAALTRAQPADP